MTYLGGIRRLVSFAQTRSIHNQAIVILGTGILSVSANCPYAEIRGIARAALIRCPPLGV
jgi:hypothetical protein